MREPDSAGHGMTRRARLAAAAGGRKHPGPAARRRARARALSDLSLVSDRRRIAAVSPASSPRCPRWRLHARDRNGVTSPAWVDDRVG